MSEYDARAQTVSAHKVPIELSSKPIAHKVPIQPSSKSTGYEISVTAIPFGTFWML